MQSIVERKQKLLCPAGKEIMIKVVLQALLTYTISFFKLAIETFKEIEKNIRRFFWGQGDDERKITWVGWQKITRTKHNGGLGFRELAIFNQAMLAKFAWRFINEPEKLWVEVLKELYCPSDNPLYAGNKKEGLWIWKSLQYGLSWQVGNGARIHIWDDPWVPTLPNFRITSKPPAGNSCFYVKDLVNEDGSG